ncbi:MAG: NAD(P)-binding domain-containing protein, partial [Dehalococcoidales bacterium]|nr:NAD(P)-binding domain-containing protein [Dehalococcoidales bacterium]
MLGKNKLTIGFIGAGTVGNALAMRLHEAGYDVTAVYSRTRSSAEKLAARVNTCRVMDSGQAVADTAGLTFITTPDGAIPTVAGGISW